MGFQLEACWCRLPLLISRWLCLAVVSKPVSRLTLQHLLLWGSCTPLHSSASLGLVLLPSPAFFRCTISIAVGATCTISLLLPAGVLNMRPHCVLVNSLTPWQVTSLPGISAWSLLRMSLSSISWSTGGRQVTLTDSFSLPLIGCFQQNSLLKLHLVKWN